MHSLQTAGDYAKTSKMEEACMGKFRHQFVETYEGLVGFGADRETDEHTLMVYFQMFSDDETLRKLIGRMEDAELENAFNYISGLLKKHFSEDEYHGIFLKDEHHY
jgi:hypothetical protein